MGHYHIWRKDERFAGSYGQRGRTTGVWQGRFPENSPHPAKPDSVRIAELEADIQRLRGEVAYAERVMHWAMNLIHEEIIRPRRERKMRPVTHSGPPRFGEPGWKPPTTIG